MLPAACGGGEGEPSRVSHGEGHGRGGEPGQQPRRTPRRRGLGTLGGWRRELGRPSPARRLRSAPERRRWITADRETAGEPGGVGGGRSTARARDNELGVREGPLLRLCVTCRERFGECPLWLLPPRKTGPRTATNALPGGQGRSPATLPRAPRQGPPQGRPGAGVAAGARQPWRGRHRPADHRAGRALWRGQVARRARGGPSGRWLPLAPRATGVYPEARFGGAAAAVDPGGPRPRRAGGREDGDRADLRGRLSALLVRLSAAAGDDTPSRC